MESKVYQVTTNPLETGPLKATMYLTTRFNNELGSEFIADFETEEKANEICAILNQSLRQQPGAVWIKASERLPEPFKVVPCKYTPDSPDPRKDTELHWGFVSKEGVWSRLWQNHQVDWLDESAAAGREDWISVEERPLIKRNDEWWELTEDGEKEFIAAVPYHDAETDDPKKKRWWIRHCYIDSEGYLNVKRDNEMDEDVAGWNVSDITHWTPLPEPPKQQKEK